MARLVIKNWHLISMGIFNMNKINSKGFSLVETVVSIGLLGILGVISMSIFQDINNTQRSIEESQGLDLFTGKISSILLDHDECTANLRGIAVNEKVGAIYQFKSSKNSTIKFKNDDIIEGKADIDYGKQIIGAGADSQYSRPFSRDYFIEDMILEKTGNSGSVALVIKFKKDKNRPGVAEIKRKINLYADFGTEGGNKVLSCYSDLSRLKDTLIAKACGELTGSEELNSDGHCVIPTYKQTDCEKEFGKGYHLVGFKKELDDKLYVPDCQKLDLKTGYHYDVGDTQTALQAPNGSSLPMSGSAPRLGDSGPIITGSNNGTSIPISNQGFLTNYNVQGVGSSNLNKLRMTQLKPAIAPETGTPNGGSDLHCDNAFGTAPEVDDANGNQIGGGKRYRNQYGSINLTVTSAGIQLNCN